MKRFAKEKKMNRYFLRLVLVALFALSAGAAGAVFAVASSAAPLDRCPTACNFDSGCPGSDCNCFPNMQGKYVCVPPGQSPTR